MNLFFYSLFFMAVVAMRADHYSPSGHHNVQFDHEAFLGPELAKELSSHTFGQNTKKLIEIFSKIDLDSNKELSENEMYQWIQKVATQSVEDNSRKRWNEVNINKMPELDFEEFLKNSYGEEADLKQTDFWPRYENYKKNDQRRWKHADMNGDGKLSFEEFKAFSFPNDFKHMKPVLTDETIEKIDKDKDGLISLEEFVNDIARLEHRDPDPKSDWAMKEAANFDKYRDLDHNGKLDRAEVNEWVSPSNYDPIEAETKHLFYHSDSNKDNKLSLKEVVDSQDIFVGSQATEYGKHLEHNEF